MPFYEVEHVFTLPPVQEAALAEAITAIHSEAFGTPRLFVNVRFALTTEARDYVGGKRRRVNRIRASVRSGGGRSQEQWNGVVTKITEAWREILHPEQDVPADSEKELRAVLLSGGLLAGWEAGFLLPSAGGDAQWVKDHANEFRQRATNEDPDFAALVKELEERTVFGGDPKLAEQRAAEARKEEEKNAK